MYFFKFQNKFVSVSHSLPHFEMKEQFHSAFSIYLDQTCLMSCTFMYKKIQTNFYKLSVAYGSFLVQKIILFRCLWEVFLSGFLLTGWIIFLLWEEIIAKKRQH